jgi:hypothetical protein
MFETLIVLFSLASHVLAGTGSGNLRYSTVTGYFLQDNNSTNATTFDYVRR